MKKKIIVIICMAGIVSLISMTIGRTFVANILSGRVHFPEANVGEDLTMPDGTIFTVLRRLSVDGKNDTVDDYAVFRVRFQFKSLPLTINKRLSMIPAPFLMGMKGFREKYWTFNEETQYFQGIYQWESKAVAEKYPDSFIYKLMTKRARPGTLSYEIIPQTNLLQYIKSHSAKT